jgi:hypothetical protein
MKIASRTTLRHTSSIRLDWIISSWLINVGTGETVPDTSLTPLTLDEKNLEARERILKKTNEYVSRAEILKAHLSGPRNSEVGVMTHGGEASRK